MATPWKALNTYLYASLDNGTTYHKVAGIQDFNGPKLKRDEIDVTTHDVTDDYKVFIASLKDSQTLDIVVVLDPTDAGHNETQPYGLKSLFESGTVVKWKMVWPTSPPERVSFSGFVNAYAFMAKVKDAIMANSGIRVSGASVMESGGTPP